MLYAKIYKNALNCSEGGVWLSPFVSLMHRFMSVPGVGFNSDVGTARAPGLKLKMGAVKAQLLRDPFPGMICHFLKPRGQTTSYSEYF